MKALQSIKKTYSNDLVDRDVQSMLLPLNLMQYIMFCPKYRIKDNIITPNSLISNCVSIIGTLMFMLALVHCNYVVLTDNSLGYNDFMYCISYGGCFFFCFGFAINCVSGLIQTKHDVQFVLTFQKVHRFINSVTSLNRIILWNWVMVLEVLGFYAIVDTYFYIRTGVPFYGVYAFYLLVIFDFNIVYAVRVIYFLENKVVLWNTRDFNSEELDVVHEENYCTRVFQAYVNILECYDNFKHSFQQFILYYIIKTFAHSLVHTKAIIDVFQIGLANDMDKKILPLTTMFITLLHNLMYQAILVKRCEKFYSAVQNVQDTCTLILKSSCSEYEKKLYKNVLRLHRASFSKIRTCSLFYVDAALLFNLMCLITNYTVVFLQFAFL